MTLRERRLVMATFGCIEALISFVSVADLLINGRIYPGLSLLLFLVAMASGPFVVPSLIEALKEHKLPVKTDEERRDLPNT